MSKNLVGLGAALGIVMSLLLFGATGWYLFKFMNATNRSVEDLLSQPVDASSHAKSLSESVLLTRFGMARIAFNSCGLVVGLAMAFLAVALFLFGVSDSMDVQAEHQNARLNISRMSAGGFAILCSTAIVITCVFVKPSLEFEGVGRGGRTEPSSDSAEKANSITEQNNVANE